MTKGYKATYNYKCLNQTYEIGQEYKLDQKPRICKSGFHYCKEAKETLFYYNYNNEFKLLEIEDLSNNTITQDDKSCSNHIKIIREITDPEELLQLLYRFYTYDKNGNELTYKDSTGYFSEYTYAEDGQELTYKDSTGYFSEYTYAEDGQELTYKGSNGYWRERTYDENGNQLTYKNSTGYFCEKTYTKSGKQLTCKDSTGYWSEYTYDENGNQLNYKNSNDN